MSEVNCNLCKKNDYSFLFRLDDFDLPLNIVRCNNCGLIYQNPQPEHNYINSLYSEDYYIGGSKIANARYLEKRRIISKERLKIIERIKRPGRILDIGCCFGTFLEAAKKRGWEPYGVEISQFPLKKAKEIKGLKIFLGELSNIHLQENFFDLVTIFEVIEHLFTPLETLMEIHKILKDDGILIVQTTNMDSLRAKILEPKAYYYSPVHLYYFTKKTIIRMLKKAGFEIFKIFNGSEFGISTELKLFKDGAPLRKLLVRKLLNKVEFRGFTLNSVMVVYAKKSH